MINDQILENETSSILNYTIQLGEGYGGLITCNVTNPAGSNNSNLIAIYTRPVIVVPPMDTYVVVVRDVNLTCTAIGYPIPSYQWMRFNGSLPTNSIVTNTSSMSTLSLYSVDLEDEGVYNCTVTGFDGYSVSESAVLTG